MRKRRNIPVGTLFMILILALATLGVGYGLWSKLLLINGTIETGTVDAIFYDAFTDDDGKENNVAKDLGDVGVCPEYGDSSCDPNEFGPNPTRYDKDVGHCVAMIDPDDAELLHITVLNGYPSYYCTVWFDILNNGSIPLKIQSLSVAPAGDWTNGEEVTVALSELACGQQIDPGILPDGSIINLAQGDIHIHVEQAAEQKGKYEFDAQLFLVQWNEFDDTQCPVD
jgi:hypothetical protein